MIKDKKLWLTDSSYMNDKEEIIWVDKVVLTLLKTEIKDSAGENKEYYENLKKEYEKLTHKKHFLMCFSEEKDSLSQWRAYGDDAKGVAIGFNRNILPDREEMNGQVNNGKAFSITNQLGVDDVNYEINNYFENILKRRDPSNTNLKALVLKETAVVCKHKSFIEEKEVRFIYTPENIKKEDDDVSRLSKKLFRPQNGNIVPYYEYDFKDLKNFLLEIILGSKCALNKTDLAEYLKSEDFNNVEINNSSSSYR